MGDFVTRFAPSPTGYLHLGHAASAFHVWDAARTAGGAVLLRIEDIDRTRCRPDYETAILEDLEWLGFDWPEPVRRQSDHFPDYAAVLESLQARGLIYRCFRTRREITAALPAGADPDMAGYTGRPLPEADEAAHLARGNAFAWRLSLAAARDALGPRYRTLSYIDETGGTARSVAADPAPYGDVVLARKDTPASYHLACCHDDALQGVTHVIRGEDIREMTAIHALLQALMDWPQPVYRFHPLIIGPDGRKLSKRAGDRGLRAYRDEGMTPDDLRRLTGLA
ncbi:MAG: tRNA glutamyl-Q(34) synthetase GluQRS [Hyphomonas sp.]|uniref:tRNA glutamyl-Q(34) synthetase GluQRS n=1 Tax=Hyphomonas sp. TaxID=87 RepID=UPI003526E9C7